MDGLNEMKTWGLPGWNWKGFMRPRVSSSFRRLFPTSRPDGLVMARLLYQLKMASERRGILGGFLKMLVGWQGRSWFFKADFWRTKTIYERIINIYIQCIYIYISIYLYIYVHIYVYIYMTTKYKLYISKVLTVAGAMSYSGWILEWLG